MNKGSFFTIPLTLTKYFYSIDNEDTLPFTFNGGLAYGYRYTFGNWIFEPQIGTDIFLYLSGTSHFGKYHQIFHLKE